MTPRPVLRRIVPAALAAVLVGLAAPPATQGESTLPPCPADAPPSTHGPSAPPRPDDPTACRARAPRPVAAGGLPRPQSGYHHLGATTAGRWSGVQGRLTVRDPGVRAGSNDFVAARFMAKREANGRMSWLEAGWAETGWSGGDRQRVYTFDTSHNAWAFYDQYPVRAGDEIWIYLNAEGNGASPLWQAWLWWSNTWHLLAAESLPLTGQAQLEQYVEVYVDPERGDTTLPVPPIRVDNVQVTAEPRGRLGYWREEGVSTEPGAGTRAYCLDWRNRYDTWVAGDC